MTAGVIFNSGYRFRLWPKSTAEQLQDIGVPTLDRQVWKQHKHDVVWPETPTLFSRLWRVVAGAVTGFWIIWLMTGGNMKKTQNGAELVVVTSTLLAFLSAVAMIIWSVVGYFGLFQSANHLLWMVVLSLFLPIVSVYSVYGHPLGDNQMNWFYKKSTVRFQPHQGAGPKWSEVPPKLRDRIGRAERAGFSVRLAWNEIDPLVEVYPPYQPWRAVCVGGWSTDNPQIDDL